MAKYFLDTEFHEYKNNGVDTIELISIGIVCEDGREYYQVCKDFNFYAAYANDWLRENVLKNILRDLDDAIFSQDISYFIYAQTLLAKHGNSLEQIKSGVLDFISNDEHPEFYGYYCDYDWVVFCWLFGRMIDLPKHFPMYCRDLKQMLDSMYMNQVNKYEGKTRLEAWLEDVKKHPNYPKQENEHNALADARWNKALYDFLNAYDYPNNPNQPAKRNN